MHLLPVTMETIGSNLKIVSVVQDCCACTHQLFICPNFSLIAPYMQYDVVRCRWCMEALRFGMQMGGYLHKSR